MIGELIYKKRTFGVRDNKFPILSLYLLDNDEYVGWIGPSDDFSPSYVITTNISNVRDGSIRSWYYKSEKCQNFKKSLRRLCDMILADEKAYIKHKKDAIKREQGREKIIEELDSFRRKYKNE